MSDLYRAYQIHTGEWQRRLEIEARLLARRTPEEITAAVGATPEVIELFHDLFFDVTGRINASDYITKAAIWKGARARGRDHAAEAFVRALAYFGGTVMLDVVLPCLNGSAGGHRQGIYSVASPALLYEKTRRLLELFVEFSSEEHSSSSPRKERQLAVTNHRVRSVEANQKAEELVKSGALQTDKRPVWAVDLATGEVPTVPCEAVEVQFCEAG